MWWCEESTFHPPHEIITIRGYMVMSWNVKYSPTWWFFYYWRIYMVLSWNVKYSPTEWIFYYWRIYMVLSWNVKYSSTGWIFYYWRIHLYSDELERQIFIQSMNFLLLKDIWWWAGTSNIHPPDEFFTIEGYTWWWAGTPNIHPPDEFFTIEEDIDGV